MDLQTRSTLPADGQTRVLDRLAGLEKLISPQLLRQPRTMLAERRGSAR